MCMIGNTKSEIKEDSIMELKDRITIISPENMSGLY